MSTAGSVRSESGMSYTPPSTDAGAKKRSSGFFRWKGIFALLFFAIIAVGGWILFADLILKSTISEAATKALGVEVAIDKLHLSLSGTSLDIRGLTVAHPSDPMVNVIDVGHAHVQLAGAPLLRKRIVITNLVVDSVRGLT